VSREARADLDGIWDYIAERADMDTAEEFIWKFYETFSSIASSPRAGVSVPDFAPGDVRKFPMGNYLIYYRAARNKILIARVLHGKRLQRRAFLSEQQ
jgi:plasmid stabilization system protein ParE